MDEHIKTILAGFADNETLFAAVKDIIKQQFNTSETELDVFDDERLGQRVRARIEGLKKVDEAFKSIARYKTTPARGEAVNPAR